MTAAYYQQQQQQQQLQQQHNNSSNSNSSNIYSSNSNSSNTQQQHLLLDAGVAVAAWSECPQLAHKNKNTKRQQQHQCERDGARAREPHEAKRGTKSHFGWQFSCCSGSFCVAGGRCFHSQIARRWQRLCRARKAREKSKENIQLDQAKEIESKANSNKCSIANNITQNIFVGASEVRSK